MTAENLITTEQMRVNGAQAALKALKKMDRLAHIEAPSQEQYWRNWDEAIAGVRTAAGDMSPTAEGVLMVLAEYISIEFSGAGEPRTDGGWKPEAAMTHGEVLAYRKSFDQSYEESNRE